MTSDSCDFPAAHSMDTTWFAVDREGHVAVFDSEDPGAVPETAPADLDADTLDALLTLPEIGEPTLDIAALVHPGHRKVMRPPKHKVPSMWPYGDVFVVVEPAPAVDEVTRAVPEIVSRPFFGPFTVLRLSSRDEVKREDPRAQAWAAFLRSGNDSPWLVTGVCLYGDEADLARRGVFVFRAHTARYNRAEPYGRVLVPPQPLRVHDMPADVQGALAKIVRLDVSFTAEAYVQPAEHVPCALYRTSAIYLARDGRTVRAIKGREAEAKNEAENLKDRGDDFEPVIFDPALTE